MVKKYSLLYPKKNVEYKTLSPVSMHDLGLDNIIRQLSVKEAEQNMIMNIMSRMCADTYVIKYRCDIFEDIINNKKLREELMTVLDKINFLKNYGGLSREIDDGSNVWNLMHRLDEINDYINCVDMLHDCMLNAGIKSDGLTGLREYIEEIYKDNGFGELKKDIMGLKFDTSELKSITVGINLNDRFEANGIGLISINNKQFTKSSVLSNFCDHIASKDRINKDTEWKDNYKYHPIEQSDLNAALDTMNRVSTISVGMRNPIYAPVGVASVADSDSTKDVTHYMDRIVNQMVSGIVKNLKSVLAKYVSVTITNMTDLIPELLYYIKWAEYIEAKMSKGAIFSKPSVMEDTLADKYLVRARGIYNIKLAAYDNKESEAIVTNDFDFDKEHRLYILTGANRGGKTTITQAVGQLFVLAQGGIYIPGDGFDFSPIDCVYTHFPADEDKTFDLGRLGEECKRFKEMYSEATDKSLLLMNETFSTTSFEEGYYIAKDCVKAILNRGIRTIYNTHMHKLAYDVDEINEDMTEAMAYSMIVRNEGEKRSYKVEVAPPCGKSFASDIAKKYGVTYEMLSSLT